MVDGTHAIIDADDADRARAFLRDTLGLPFVDAHGGWPIFKLPPAALGIHPAGNPGEPSTGPPRGHQEIYLMCDDIVATVEDLTRPGVTFTTPVQDQGFGRLVRFVIPGAGEIGLYQPRHDTAYDLE